MRARIVHLDGGEGDREKLREAGRILQAGGLVAFPTETVYGLGGNALDPDSSRKIYEAKGRPSDNPLIVHIADIGSLERIAADIPDAARRLADACWPGPLTMIFSKKECVPRETTGGLDSVAVRFPDHPAARGLIREAGGFVAAPSANTSGRPSPTCAAHVAEDLGDRIDMILDGGPVRIGLESTIVDFTGNLPMILRPGWLNQEMLSQILGEVRMDPGLMKDDPQVRPKAPGMRYRHYAPKAKLVIVEGSPAGVTERIRELVREGLSEGKKVGIICTRESRELYPEGRVRCIGSLADEKTIAQHLYGILRDFDADGTELIYSEAYYTPQLGQAIMNRLIRAAGHTVIHTGSTINLNITKDERSKAMLGVGCDHGGFALMEEVRAHLKKRGIEFKDFGCFGTESVDYPDYAEKVCEAIQKGECENGILICGTGIGISIAANKMEGIRAALCGDSYSAELTRLHNNANVLCMGGRVIGPDMACKIVDLFLDTPFSEDERHKRRIAKAEALYHKKA